MIINQQEIRYKEKDEQSQIKYANTKKTDHKQIFGHYRIQGQSTTCEKRVHFKTLNDSIYNEASPEEN